MIPPAAADLDEQRKARVAQHPRALAALREMRREGCVPSDLGAFDVARTISPPCFVGAKLAAPARRGRPAQEY
jgi:hypothetical protein